jgi:cytochrome c-type biogenesis protein CcmE
VPELFFNEHSDIVAEGTYDTDGVFHADNIMVKCPSKYVAELVDRS